MHKVPRKPKTRNVQTKKNFCGPVCFFTLSNLIRERYIVVRKRKMFLYSYLKASPNIRKEEMCFSVILKWGIGWKWPSKEEEKNIIVAPPPLPHRDCYLCSFARLFFSWCFLGSFFWGGGRLPQFSWTKNNDSFLWWWWWGGIWTIKLTAAKASDASCPPKNAPVGKWTLGEEKKRWCWW